MSDPTPEEEAILESVLEGLALSIQRSSELTADSTGKLSDTKLEKLVYKALKGRNTDDQVTLSWYLAGAKTDVSASQISSSRFKEIYEEMTGTKHDSKEFKQKTRDYTPSTDAEDYADFFSYNYDLEEAWYTRGEFFLLDFYKEDAPEEYRNLYIEIQKLRNQLNFTIWSLKDIVEKSKKTQKLSSFGQHTPVTGPDTYKEVTDLVSGIHLELSSHEQLRDVFSQFRAFTDIVEDAYLALSKIEVERIDSTQVQAFKKLRRFYFYEAWRLPALLISMETSQGPRANNLKVRHARELEDLNQQYQDKIRRLQRQCSEAALTPTVADYRATHDQDSNQLTELISIYVNKS